MGDRTSKQNFWIDKDQRIADLDRELRRTEEARVVAIEKAATLKAMLIAAREQVEDLFSISGMCAMVLDAQLHIKSMTPGMERYFNIIDSDIGRPITDLTSNLHYDELEHDVEQVIAELDSKELLIQSKDGRWFSMRIAPIWDASKAVEGVVITMSDVTNLKNAEHQAKDSGVKLLNAVGKTSIVVWHQDRDLRYTWIYNPNPAFRPESVVGKTDEDLLPAEEAAYLTRLKRMVLDTGVGTRQNVATTIDGIHYYYDLVVEPSLGENSTVVGLSCASIEIDRNAYEARTSARTRR